MITANDYERTYVCVKNSLNATRKLDNVVEFLQNIARPVTCQEIGLFVWGDAYKDFHVKNSYSAQLGQMLRHLRRGGFIKMEERKGDPIEIEVEDYILDNNTSGEPPRITVYDKQGREYDIPNPNYVAPRRRGHWGMVKKTVTPTIKTYIWVA